LTEKHFICAVCTIVVIFYTYRFLGAAGAYSARVFAGKQTGTKPVVISTWKEGINANKAAWQVLRSGGRALDAVEDGVKVTEASQNCCVGLGAYPDRDGIVTLDACIMDEREPAAA
jgi:N4-(beta-N-acetylglucosaminyl)-L-asparaginase